jgi:2-keto-4-pentenoate hydratase/2-oxohepta-3-ene-1,7-dioic acid hydratase in catechol pathway
MRIATIHLHQEETAAVMTPAGAVPVNEINRMSGQRWPADLFALIQQGQLDALSGWLNGLTETQRDDLAQHAIPEDKVAYAPLYRHPSKIWGIGLNYVDHAKDLSEVAPSEEPASFMKPDTTIIGPGDVIQLPPQSQRVTGEAELGVIIGKKVKNISEAEAPQAIAGLTTIIDMTAEDILQKNPRYLTRAKSFDTFFSFGPQLVTPDEIDDIEALEVSTIINGRLHRKNVVANMTFSPWFLVSFHSKVMTLLPGDIISTGTPGAVVIRDGDIVACHINGFAPLSNPVRG